MEIEETRRKRERAKSKRRQNLLSLALLSPYLIIFVLFTLIPVVMGFAFSFMKYNPYNGETNAFIGLKNYLNIFDFNNPVTKSFWNSFGTMLVFDIVAVPCLMIIPMVLAYFINMHPPGYKIFRAIIYLPSVVSITIVGIIFGNMFAGTKTGLINSWLGTEIHWLAGQPFHGDTLRWLVMLIASIWWQTGTNFIIFSGALRDIPKSLYEACEMDGGKRRHLIRFVTLPNMKSAISICLFNTLIGYLNLYGQPVVLNELDNAGVLVSPMMFIQKYISGVAYASQTGYICACAIIFGLFVMLLSTIERRVMGERRRSRRRTVAAKRYLADRDFLKTGSLREPDFEGGTHDSD